MDVIRNLNPGEEFNLNLFESEEENDTQTINYYKENDVRQSIFYLKHKLIEISFFYIKHSNNIT